MAFLFSESGSGVVPIKVWKALHFGNVDFDPASENEKATGFDLKNLKDLKDLKNLKNPGSRILGPWLRHKRISLLEPSHKASFLELPHKEFLTRAFT